MALLLMLVVVAGLYIEHALSYLAARSQDDQQQSIVQRLVRENAALSQEQKSLTDPATIRGRARALGMVMPGERPYAVIGVSSQQP